MYFSNLNSGMAKLIFTLAISTLFYTQSNADSIYSTVCMEDGSTETIFYSEDVTMVGATTDSSFPSYSGSFLTGFSGTVWSATGDIEGPVDGVSGRASMGTLATVTRPLVLIDYGLNIPCNATITDVNFNITRRNADLDDIQDLEIRLRLPDYSLSATNMASGANWLESTTTWETVSYNDATWGETLTADMLNDPRFGIWIIVNKSQNADGARAEIDAVEIEVCYDVNGAAFESIEMAVTKGNTSCGELNGQININAQNGSGDFEFSIDNGLTWSATPTFNNLAPGSYLVTVRNTDGTCQTATFNCLVGADDNILQPGDAVITCDPFGTPVTLVVERLQPFQTFYTNGYQGSDVSDLVEPSPYTWTTTDLGGEVWSTALDDDLNIYTGTTSLYSPTTNSATVLSVIDAMTGVASQIGTLPGNKGIAGIEYDNDCDQLFAANLEDGIIYRVDPTTGATLSTFDPLGADTGVAGYEPLGERILGLAYNPTEQRLYYAVWANDQIDNGNRNTIRSIAIDPTSCDFLPATDVEEFQLPFLSEECGDSGDTYSMPVTDIEFNSTGTTILLAESGINSTNFIKVAHKSRVLEYDGSTGAWSLDNTPFPGNPNGCKYGVGTHNEENNSRGGVDFANAGFDGAGCLTGVDDFFVTTVDGAFGVNCVESCVYGLQYTSTGGGGPFQSVGMDVDRDNNSQLKSVYGDVDMVPGCLVSDPVLCQDYDLALSVSLTTTGPYSPGDVVTYEILVENQGDIAASNVDITSNAQTGLVYQTSTVDANVTDNGNETFQIAALPVGGTQVIEMMYQIDPTFTGSTLDLIALITGDDGDDIDSDPATDQTVDEDADGDPYDDDEDIVSLPVTILDYDLALSVSLTTTGPYNPGDVVTYEILVENQGDIAASNVDITSNSQTGLVYQSSTADANVTDNGNETFQIAALPVGGTQVIEMMYQIDPTFAGSTLDLIALITGDDGDDIDSDPATDQTVDEDADGDPYDDDEDIASLAVTILDYDLSLTKTLTTAGPHLPGNNVTFDIVVTNEGDVAANGVVVTDSSPVDLIYQSMTADANLTDNGNETFTIASLPIGGSQTITLTYQIDANFTGTSLNNIAQITSDDGDDIDSNPAMDETMDENGDGNPFDDDEDEATVSTTILDYDLSLTKTLTSASPHLPGNNVTFNIVVTNEGDVAANGVVVTDSSPADLIYQSMTADANLTDNGNETFTIAMIPAGGAQTITLTYQIDANFTGATLNNIAQITSDDGDDIDSDPNDDETVDEDGDGNPFDDDEDEATISTTILDYDLSLTKTLTTTGQIVAGDNVTFDIVVTNEGDIAANNVVVTENSPADLIYQSMTADANLTDNGNETFTIGTIPVGGTQIISVTYQVDANFAGTGLTNVALITADDGDDIDSNPNDNETVDEDLDGNPFDDDEDDEDVVITVLDYDLALTKTLGSTGPFMPGDEITFILTVFNEGDAFATNIEVTDNAPAALTYVGSSTNANFVDNMNGTFTILNLPAGLNQAIEVTYTIDPSFTGTSLANVALITADDGDDSDSDPGQDETVDEDGDGDPLDDDEDIFEFDVTPFALPTLLGDYVWEDVNGDGVQDATEPGIEGVQVVLHTPDGVVVSTQYTDSNGFYEFADAAAGEYYIEYIPPFGMQATFPNTNNNDTSDSDIDNSNGLFTTPLFTLEAGEQDLNWDAGFYNCIPVGDLVWFDSNENDVWDSVENGVNGMRVNIHRRQTNGSYILWDYTFTGPNTTSPSDDGYFKFCVPPGDYYLEFIDPPFGLVLAQPNVGNDEENDSDATGANGPGTTNTMTFNSGMEVCNIGAGYYPMGTIGDFVFMDSNQNGVRDPNESGIGNVYIEAYNVEGEVIGSASSNSDGQYMIDYLPQEDVYLKFYSNSNLASTVANVGDDDFDSDIDHSNGPMTTQYFNIYSGEHRGGVDAGFVFGTVAAEWLSIDGVQRNNHNIITWNVGAQVNTSHYEIERSISDTGDFALIGSESADLSSGDGAKYEFNDFDLVESGTYFYRVKMLDNNGDFNYSQVISIDVDLSARLEAFVGVYPNPMVDEFTLELSLTQDQDNISFEVFNANGKIALANVELAEKAEKGKHSFKVDVSTLSEGIYTLKVNTGASSSYKKIIIIK